MLQLMLITLAAVWLLDGLALLANPRGVMTLLKHFIEQHGGVRRWWALTSGLGLALLWVPPQFPYRPLWISVGCAMLIKGLFLGTAPDSWRASALAWCLSRDDVDYRLWGLGLCALAIVLWHSLARMSV